MLYYKASVPLSKSWLLRRSPCSNSHDNHKVPFVFENKFIKRRNYNSNKNMLNKLHAA